MKENMINIWYRRGDTQDVTFEEFMTLLDYCCPDGIVDKDKYNYSDKSVDEILSNFNGDGDSYIPSEVMKDLAKENGIELCEPCDEITVEW